MPSCTAARRSPTRSPRVRYQNDYFQDVLPVGDGLAQIPFPPLPAILLLPFVAVFGLGTNGAAVAAVLGALNVVLCWVMLLGVTPRRSAALLGTLFYGFGTVAWYAAMLGTTWFLAHVVASTFLFLAISVAVRADRAALAASLAARSAGGARPSPVPHAPCVGSSSPGCSSGPPRWRA